MAVELKLTHVQGDRRLYALEGVGTLRLNGWGSRTATAEAGGQSWRIVRRGTLRRVTEIADAAGTPVGEFSERRGRRACLLRWGDRELTLQRASRWRQHYELADGGRELAVLDGKGWGRRPVKVTLEQPGAVEPGLLLFAAFVVRGLAQDAAAAA